MRNEKSVVLKLTAAIVVDGNIVRAGGLVEMVESEAKDLLRRGKAVLATEQDDAGGDDNGADAGTNDGAPEGADSAAQAALAATVDSGADAAPARSRRTR